jgi:hypothetical protein
MTIFEWLFMGENNFWNIMSGLGTIVAIIFILFTYRRYREEKITKEVAQVNTIIDEIYHNLNLAEIFFPKYGEPNINLIISELDNLSEVDRYPNPTDAIPPSADNHRLFSIYNEYNKDVFFNWDLPIFLDKFILFKSNAITHAMATGNAAVLLSKRIFLNLGHLEYSLRRINNLYEEWNQRSRINEDVTVLKTRLTNIKKEYFLWL